MTSKLFMLVHFSAYMQSTCETFGDSKKLRVIHADPLDYRSIVEAMDGCCGLFYSFEPPSDQLTYSVCSPSLSLQLIFLEKVLKLHACVI